MADPRAAVDFKQIMAERITMKRKLTSTGAINYNWSPTNHYQPQISTDLDKALSCIENDTARLGQAGDQLLGQLKFVDGDFCTVQVRGVMVFSYVAGANAPVFSRGVVCDGSGGVRIAGTGLEYKEAGRILNIDATNLKVTILL